MVSATKLIPTSEFEAVIKAADAYVNGLRIGIPNSVAEAFHKDAIMYGIIDPATSELMGGHISNLYNYVKESGSSPDIKARSDILALTPTTAVVRVDMENVGAGADYTDFLTLVKIDGRWQIISKAFHKY